MTTNLRPLLNVTAQPGSISFCESAYSQRSRISVRAAVSLIYRVYVSNCQTNLHYGQATEVWVSPQKSTKSATRHLIQKCFTWTKERPIWLRFLRRFQHSASYEVWGFITDTDVQGKFPRVPLLLAKNLIATTRYNCKFTKYEQAGFWLILSNADKCSKWILKLNINCWKTKITILK